jgi:site-specific recombinase XerD
VMRGVGLYRAQTLLGQKTARMTQRYAHLSPDYLREAVEALCSPKTILRGPGLGPG